MTEIPLYSAFKKIEYGIIQNMVTLGIPMSLPIDFGVCDNGKSVYTLLSWVDGDEVESQSWILQ